MLKGPRGIDVCILGLALSTTVGTGQLMIDLRKAIGNLGRSSAHSSRVCKPSLGTCFEGTLACTQWQGLTQMVAGCAVMGLQLRFEKPLHLMCVQSTPVPIYNPATELTADSLLAFAANANICHQSAAGCYSRVCTARLAAGQKAFHQNLQFCHSTM